jgi:hypothetical protein
MLRAGKRGRYFLGVFWFPKTADEHVMMVTSNAINRNADIKPGAADDNKNFLSSARQFVIE